MSFFVLFNDYFGAEGGLGIGRHYAMYDQVAVLLFGGQFHAIPVLDFVQVESVSSEAYCVHKLSEVQATSRALAKTLSGMHLDLCSSDALERLSFYKDSYASNRINKSEYEELVRDLQRLVRADTAYCTEEQNELMKKTVTAISSVVSAFK